MPDASPGPLAGQPEAPPTVAAEEGAETLLMKALEVSPLPVFDGHESADAAALKTFKEGADQLVKLKLARYADEGRTEIILSNAGRYWAMHGGYMAFLKEEPPSGGGRGRNPEMDALRFEYMRLRLNTFWWSFGLAIASFVISIISLTVAFLYGDRLFR